MGAAQPDRPALCEIRCRTSTASLPAAANSGQYVDTGALKSSSPASASTSADNAVMVFVVEYTFTNVSRSHGVVRVGSAQPPQMSTTGSPSTNTATLAPRSAPLLRLSASTVRTAAYRSSQSPWTSVAPWAVTSWVIAPPQTVTSAWTSC